MKNGFVLLLAVVAGIMAGCASFDGRGLQPGRSTLRDVQTLMGVPTEQRDTAHGGRVLYYSRQPFGRQTFAVKVDADGVMRAIEPLLTYDHILQLRVNDMNRDQAMDLLGPPYRITRMPRQQRDAWEYYTWLETLPMRLYLNFSDDGVVREVVQIEDFPTYADPVSPPGR